MMVCGSQSCARDARLLRRWWLSSSPAVLLALLFVLVLVPSPSLQQQQQQQNGEGGPPRLYTHTNGSLIVTTPSANGSLVVNGVDLALALSSQTSTTEALLHYVGSLRSQIETLQEQINNQTTTTTTTTTLPLGTTTRLGTSTSDATTITTTPSVCISPAFIARTVTSFFAGPYAMDAADIDGDGDLDVVSASYPSGPLVWFENVNGDGSSFVAQTITADAEGAFSVHAADIDGDGHVDIAVGSIATNTVSWYRNNGNRNARAFTKVAVASSVIVPHRVFAADVDADGDVDILCASSGDNRVTIFDNFGTGSSFRKEVVTTEARGARSVFAADLDGDGDLDVLSASSSDDKVAWYSFDGKVSRFYIFTARTLTTTLDGASSVHAADIDGDGDVDVLSTSWDDNTVAWFENQGQNFVIHVISRDVEGASGVTAADMDGDGDMDVVSVGKDDGSVTWFENMDGSGMAFEAHVISTTANNARIVFAGDVDGDGDQDLVVSSYGNNNIIWYENTCA